MTMTLKLEIKGELIEEVPMNYSGCHCSEERTAKTKQVAGWLKYKYRQSLMITDKWVIWLVAQ